MTVTLDRPTYAELEERIYVLETELAQLRGTPEEIQLYQTHVVFHLTRNQARMLNFLMQVDQATIPQIRHAIYGESIRSDKCVEVLMCNLRKRLKPLGLGIETLWGEGRRLNPATKEKISEILRSQAA